LLELKIISAQVDEMKRKSSVYFGVLADFSKRRSKLAYFCSFSRRNGRIFYLFFYKKYTLNDGLGK
jgi:hypothetical protein